MSRTVDPGQTVAASLQAPTLFTIAQDLTRMQVEAAVDEADVGRLREGMAAIFTVDAFPGRTFRGEISQIRKAAQVVQNVVSYTTVITVPNPDRSLLPGMTANVRVQVDRREDALRVPNAALRFRPPDGQRRALAQPRVRARRRRFERPGGDRRGRSRGRRVRTGGRWRRRCRQSERRAPRDARDARPGSRPDAGAAGQARRDPGGGAPVLRGRARPGRRRPGGAGPSGGGPGPRPGRRSGRS